MIKKHQRHPTQPVAWIVASPIAHRSIFGITEPAHQLRSRKYRWEPGKCFRDVAGVQLSFETFCVEFFAWNFRELVSRVGLPTRLVFARHPPPSSGHPPRRRRIQYAAASRFHRERPGILGRPIKSGDDGGVFGARRAFSSLSRNKGRREVRAFTDGATSACHA